MRSRLLLVSIILSIIISSPGCKKSPERFTDNGDGTLTDTKTGLLLDKKGYTVTDNGNGTLTDTETGIMWTKNANLAGGKTWQGALDFIESMNTASGSGTYGYTDWRLPSDQEIFRLLSKGVKPYHKWLNKHGFINVQSNFFPWWGGYWASSTRDCPPSRAWVVNMYDGFPGDWRKTSNGYVWPVREGH